MPPEPRFVEDDFDRRGRERERDPPEKCADFRGLGVVAMICAISGLDAPSSLPLSRSLSRTRSRSVSHSGRLARFGSRSRSRSRIEGASSDRLDTLESRTGVTNAAADPGVGVARDESSSSEGTSISSCGIGGRSLLRTAVGGRVQWWTAFGRRWGYCFWRELRGEGEGGSEGGTVPKSDPSSWREGRSRRSIEVMESFIPALRCIRRRGGGRGARRESDEPIPRSNMSSSVSLRPDALGAVEGMGERSGMERWVRSPVSESSSLICGISRGDFSITIRLVEGKMEREPLEECVCSMRGAGSGCVMVGESGGALLLVALALESRRE